jgi:hypothetical protein
VNQAFYTVKAITNLRTVAHVVVKSLVYGWYVQPHLRVSLME